MRQKSFLTGVKICSIVVISIFITACGNGNDSNKSSQVSEGITLEKVTGVAGSEWRSVGKTYNNSTYVRTYNGESYIYVVPEEAGAGSYRVFETEVGEIYKVSAELIGADVNSDEKFTAASYLTVSSHPPLRDESYVIALSNKVRGGTKVVEQFTFVATGRMSYLSLRSDRGWTYASARGISVTKVAGSSNNEDTTPPVITLNGASAVEIVEGSIYNDAGARAIDNKDGDISSKIKTLNPVDTSNVGIYIVTYNVKDLKKNQAIEVRRTVKVVAADEIEVGSCSELLGGASAWLAFGGVYNNSAYSRMYDGKTYNYIAAKEANAGLYKSFTTKVGASYKVSAELVGADENRDKNFDSSSFVTVSSQFPAVNQGNVIGSSNKISGGESVVETFTFVATSTKSYVALRSDKGWKYANVRAVSVKELAEDCSVDVPPEDTTAPVITLNGIATIEVTEGSTYNDAGAKANDNKDGEITSNIVTVNPVDTLNVGMYTITYNVKDAALNSAVEVRRTVKVVAADEIEVGSCSELLGGASAWLAFGGVYNNSAYSRMYDGKTYNYIAAKEANAGLYKSFTTKVGASYKVSAELVGADENRDKNFDSSSFVTVSSQFPAVNQGNVIGSSNKISGGESVVETFTFVATSTKSYVALRSDKGWKYANVRAVSVKELAEDCSVDVPPVAISQTLTLDKNSDKIIVLSGTDANGAILTYSITTEPRHGSLVLNANVATYTPTVNYVGTDSFEFNVNNGRDDSESAIVSIIIKNIISPSTGKPWDHGKLKVSADKRMLQHEDGTGFFWSADTVWFAPARMTREEMDMYLTNRAEKGFTVVQVNIMSLVWQRNAYGDYPFPVFWDSNDKDANGVEIPNSADNSEAFKIDQLLIKDGNQVPNEDYDRILGSDDPSISPLPYEERMAYIRRFENDTYDYWDNVEYMIDKAKEKGIYIAIVVAWGGHVDEFIKEDRAVYKKYIKDLTGLYKNKPNIIWLNGGDVYNTNLMQKPQWNWIGEALKANDQNHLVSFHGHPSSFAFQDKSWLDFNMLESGHGLNTAEQNNFIINDYAITNPVIKPTVDAETRYEEMTPHGTNVVLPKEDRIKPKDVREIEYYQLFSGAFGATYGHNSVWQVSWQEEVDRTGENGYAVRIHPLQTWDQSLDSSGAFQMQFLSELMRSRPILGRVPNQSLLVDAETTAKGTLGNGYAMVYSTSGESLRIALGKVSGSRVNIWSYNPRTGDSKILRSSLNNSGIYTFVPEDSEDWVVVIDDVSKGYGEPGEI